MWGGETYCKKGRPAQSAVFLYKKGKVWVTRWSTLFPFYKGKQLIFLSEGARRQSYSAAVERFLSPNISSKSVLQKYRVTKAVWMEAKWIFDYLALRCLDS